MPKKILPGLFLACVLAGFVPARAASLATYSGSWRGEPPDVVRYDRAATTPVGDRIRIASYNIQDFTDGVEDEGGRLPVHAEIQAQGAARLLLEIQPDIVVFQEMENAAVLALLNRQFAEPYPVAAITRLGRGGVVRAGKLNLAVLSRLPLRALRELDFTPLRGAGRPTRGLLSFIVDLDDRRSLLVYAVHLKSNYGGGWRALNYVRRRNALRILREDAEALRRTFPERKWEILVLGDMNTDADSPEFARDITLRPVRDWVDLWRGRPLPERCTIPTRYGDPAQEFPPAAFDRFVVSPELTAPPWTAGAPFVLQKGVNTANILALPGVDPGHVSDHYPVWLDLRR